jgi:uncharacterized protein
MSAQDNIRIAQQAYENFKTGDMQGLLGLFSNDIQWELPNIVNVPFSGKRQGLEKVREFFNQLAQTEENLGLDMSGFIGQGDRVVALGHYAWRVKTTGREYEADFAHLWIVRDGKLVAFKEYTDTLAVAAAFQQAQSAGQTRG